MKKIVSNLLFKFFILLPIFMIIIVLCLISQTLEPTLIKEEKKVDSIIYDQPADWTTVKAEPFQIKPIERELKGHFVDVEAPWCFFTIARIYGYEVDIDDFYNQLLGWTDDSDIYYEGKLGPDWLAENSLLYMTVNNYDFSVKDISNKDIDYLIAASKNNYPIVVWLNGKDWTQGEPFIIYKVENNFVSMININTYLTLDKDIFEARWNQCGHRAIIYGKYW